MSGLALAIATEAANKGYGEGYGKGYGEGLIKGAHDNAVEIAKRMIIAHKPPSQITEFTDLDQETLETLAEKLGVILPDPVEPP